MFNCAACLKPIPLHFLSQDPRNKRKIIVDAKLGTIFTSPLDMFSMNKQLSRHVKTNGEGMGTGS